MIVIKKLPAEAGQFRDHLPGLSDRLPPGAIALTAELDGLSVGTALVIAHPRSGTGSISVLHTPELFRHLGIGSRLLLEAERQLLDAGCRVCRVTLTLRKDKPAPELDFLRSRGYANEQLLIRTYTLRAADLLGAGRLERLVLPPGTELAPLLSASPEERAELDHLAAQLPPELHPLPEERLLHPEFSTLMKIGGRIAGWIGIQQLASNLLLFRSMYVRPEHRLHASGMALFAEVNRRHRLPERFAYQLLGVPGDNPAMLRLAERKLSPHASSIKSTVRLEKRL